MASNFPLSSDRRMAVFAILAIYIQWRLVIVIAGDLMNLFTVSGYHFSMVYWVDGERKGMQFTL